MENEWSEQLIVSVNQCETVCNRALINGLTLTKGLHPDAGFQLGTASLNKDIKTPDKIQRSCFTVTLFYSILN